MKSPRESDIQRSILDYLTLLRIPCWRNNSGAVALGDGKSRRYVRYGAKGSADILGVLPPSGRLLAIEVKRPGNKPTEHQSTWLEGMRQAGAVVCVAYSVEDVQRVLREVGVIR